MPKPLGVCVLAAALLWSACVPQVGPRTIAPTRYDYNQAIGRSWNEQLLLNLVRLRYRDSPVFLDVGSIIAQYEVSKTGAVGFELGSLPDGAELGTEVTISESPVVTYTPLEGKQFVQRLLTPMSPETLLLLSQSGWSVERLLLCCVQRIGPLYNATRAAGPTPVDPPEFEDFQVLAESLRNLQKARLLTSYVRTPASTDTSPKTSDDTSDDSGGTANPAADDSVVLVLEISGTDAQRAAHADDLERVRSLLDLSPDADTIHFVQGRLPDAAKTPPELPIVGRSLLGTLFYLSQAVNPPEAHTREGEAWVTVTRDAAGTPFDWNRLTGDLLRIQSGKEAPSDAFVRVRYKGHWFWIDETHHTSKSTFILLTYLFSLQDSGETLQGPLLTVTTGQ